MKKLLLYTIMWCAMLIFTTNAAQAAAPVPPNARIIWSVEDLTVTALLDTPTSMPIALFSGPASAEERAGYFPGGNAAASVNAFLIRTGGANNLNILIDTGYGKPVAKNSNLLKTLNALGLEPQSIDLLLLTHMHPDHIGGLLNENPKNNRPVFSRAQILVAAKELGYWLALAGTQPDNVAAAQVKAVTDTYGADILPPFEFGAYFRPLLQPAGISNATEQIFAIKALDASGHTPGHTVFQIEKNGQKLLIIGDLVHAVDLQFAIPEECPGFDLDKEAAIASRRRILDLAASQQIQIAGMHIPFPGSGLVEKAGNGYKFIPKN
jgi:glyoxylase-like metal-dependent hydrolase (beta-lactamase superfamily II)